MPDATGTQSLRIKSGPSYIPSPPMTEAERATLLKPLIDPKSDSYTANHAKNLTKVIELYETGQLTVNDEIWVVDGELVSKEEGEATLKHCTHEGMKQACNFYAQNLVPCMTLLKFSLLQLDHFRQVPRVFSGVTGALRIDEGLKQGGTLCLRHRRTWDSRT
ncbi:hypothetical protein N7495_005164 [Penicillium taxi]|uniref:uncharacterized protein n=1 Tax=Penicillium taxi TaxID=168475 RepID=UPI002544E261|nr:uncharacterized protein N7495_005164 [Penicillium taxi]KAJ5893473.1 hypothetical protein N7495_005164 [Penicillium taxi]